MLLTHCPRTGGIIRIVFRFFFNIKVCCMFSLESPHRDSEVILMSTHDEVILMSTHNIPFSM